MSKVNKPKTVAENLFYAFLRTSRGLLSLCCCCVLGYINITLASAYGSLWVSSMFMSLWPNFSLHKKPIVLD